MKNISKKFLASFLVLAMMMAMILPSMTFATEGDIAEGEFGEEEIFDPGEIIDEAEDDVTEEPGEEGEEGEEGTEGNGELATEVKPENIKLNRKIVFSGDLYSTGKCNKVKKANFFGKELTGFEAQAALVVSKVSLKNKSSIYVSFIDSEDKLRSGYIKFDSIDAIMETDYVNLNIKPEEGVLLRIEVDGEKYKINADTTVELIMGEDGIYGIKIGEVVKQLTEEEEIQLFAIGGDVNLDIANRGIKGGVIFEYKDTIKISGEAALSLVEVEAAGTGVEISGAVKLTKDGEENTLAGGTAQISKEGLNFTRATFNGEDRPQEELDKVNTTIKTVIDKVVEVVRSLFGKVFNIFSK